MFIVIVIALVQALIASAILGILLAGWWRIFEKAGNPGWTVLVPFYNTWLLVEMCRKSTLWFIMMLIPFVNLAFALLLCIELAKTFGKGPGYGIALLLLPFVFGPLLGFGDADYDASRVKALVV
jgi:hypothetical protein